VVKLLIYKIPATGWILYSDHKVWYYFNIPSFICWDSVDNADRLTR